MITNYFKYEQLKPEFKERMNFLLTNYADKKIIFFGIGEELEILLNNYNFKSLRIIAISDKKISTEKFCDIEVILPEKINNLDFDYIFIAQDNLNRAEKYLINDLNIDKQKIINVIKTDIADAVIYDNYLKKINFQNYYKKLVKKLKNKKVIIYGANSYLKAIAKICDLGKLNILAISDMSFKMHKQDEKFLNYDVCATFEIQKYNPDYVLVAEKYLTDEIIELLTYTALKNSNVKILPVLKRSKFKIVSDILNKKYYPNGNLVPEKIKFKRIFNALINSLSGQIKYNTYAKYKLPDKVRLEACTLCQLKCSSCYMRKYPHAAIGDGWLKFKDFKEFVDNNPNIKAMSLANSGEIFLNPQLLDIIKYADEKHITLDAATGVNLNTLSDEVAEALVKYKFNYINLSIDGASQETYVQYRKNGNFDKVIQNIKKINHYKELYNSEFPKMKWKYILFNHNEHEIAQAKQMAKELKINISFAFPWGDDTFTPKNPETVKKLTGMKYASVKERQEKDKTKRALNLCERVFCAPQINYDGYLLGCCILYNEHYGTNVFNQGFENALNSAEFQYSIRMLRGELPPIYANPCTFCNEYDSLTFNSSYFPAIIE